MVTQKDIANNLGVSRETVKYALSGHKGVAEKTRERVLQEAQRLGYNRDANQGARQLVARRHGRRALTGVLAVLLPENQAQQYRAPFFEVLMQGLEAQARERGLDLCYIVLGQRERLPRLLVNGSVDGVILLAAQSPFLETIEASDIPVVSLTHAGDQGTCVVADGRQGMYLATRHLLQLGHRKIGYLSHTLTFFNSTARHEGWRAAMVEAGCYRADLEQCTLTEMRQGPEAAARLLARVPGCSALVCYNDLVAQDVVMDLALKGVRVPQDLSITGFDDTAHLESFVPALTSVAYDLGGMARRAVALLAAMANGQDAPVPSCQLFPVQVVPRASTAPPSYHPEF